jgi:hypothetical protein
MIPSLHVREGVERKQLSLVSKVKFVRDKELKRSSDTWDKQLSPITHFFFLLKVKKN